MRKGGEGREWARKGGEGKAVGAQGRGGEGSWCARAGRGVGTRMQRRDLVGRISAVVGSWYATDWVKKRKAGEVVCTLPAARAAC